MEDFKQSVQYQYDKFNSGEKLYLSFWISEAWHGDLNTKVLLQKQSDNVLSARCYKPIYSFRTIPLLAVIC